MRDELVSPMCTACDWYDAHSWWLFPCCRSLNHSANCLDGLPTYCAAAIHSNRHHFLKIVAI